MEIGEGLGNLRHTCTMLELRFDFDRLFPLSEASGRRQLFRELLYNRTLGVLPKNDSSPLVFWFLIEGRG
jgi:hypothetical protein